MDLKENVEAVFRRLGMTPAQAIRLFYRQVALRNGLPFETAEIHPEVNAVTRKTFQDTDANQDLTVCEDADDLFDKLGI